MGTGCPTSSMGFGCLQALIEPYRMGKAKLQQRQGISLGATRSLGNIGIYDHLRWNLPLRSTIFLHSVADLRFYTAASVLLFPSFLLISGMESKWSVSFTNDRVAAAKMHAIRSHPSRSHAIFS